MNSKNSNKNKMKAINFILSSLQRLGKSLMLPISILPIAGLLNRLGAPDLLDISFIQDAGAILFTNLPILFSIGIAIGLAKNNHGAAALAGLVSYYIIGIVSQDINYCIQLGTIWEPELGYDDLVESGVLTKIDLQVFQGIISGILAGFCYNRFKDTKLPSWLQFFGGRRFVPIITGGFSMLVGSILGVIWPFFQKLLDAAAHWMTESSNVGHFVYGLLNRLLIPTGLHHIINTYVWFNYGSFINDDDDIVTGEITRFMSGDPTAGSYLAGFFPIMMFALPAAAAAIYICAKKENKPIIGGLIFSISFTAFLTGITEPIEFIFMFLAPGLYVAHAMLTGISLMVTSMLGILHGFSFSAGLIDYLLNYGFASRPLLIIPLGLAFAVIYFTLFVFIIKKFNLKTPGREEDLTELNVENQNGLAARYISLLGGKENIEEIESCITRIRLVLKSNKNLKEAAFKKLGAAGLLKIGNNVTQIIVGTKAELLVDDMKKIL